MVYVTIVYCYTILLLAKTNNPVRAWHSTMADSKLLRDDKLTRFKRSLNFGSHGMGGMAFKILFEACGSCAYPICWDQWSLNITKKRTHCLSLLGQFNIMFYCPNKIIEGLKCIELFHPGSNHLREQHTKSCDSLCSKLGDASEEFPTVRLGNFENKT
jgi:hypothetical protein